MPVYFTSYTIIWDFQMYYDLIADIYTFMYPTLRGLQLHHQMKTFSPLCSKTVVGDWCQRSVILSSDFEDISKTGQTRKPVKQRPTGDTFEQSDMIETYCIKMTFLMSMWKSVNPNFSNGNKLDLWLQVFGELLVSTYTPFPIFVEVISYS